MSTSEAKIEFLGWVAIDSGALALVDAGEDLVQGAGDGPYLNGLPISTRGDGLFPVFSDGLLLVINLDPYEERGPSEDGPLWQLLEERGLQGPGDSGTVS